MAGQRCQGGLVPAVLAGRVSRSTDSVPFRRWRAGTSVDSPGVGTKWLDPYIPHWDNVGCRNGDRVCWKSPSSDDSELRIRPMSERPVTRLIMTRSFFATVAILATCSSSPVATAADLVLADGGQVGIPHCNRGRGLTFDPLRRQGTSNIPQADHGRQTADRHGPRSGRAAHEIVLGASRRLKSLKPCHRFRAGRRGLRDPHRRADAW